MYRKSATIIVILLLLLALASTSRVQADATPTPDHGHMESTPEADEHDHGARIPANGAEVKIIAPKDGDVLERDNVIVRVETTNWPLGEGRHWHLYVNGKEQGMSQGNASALQARDLQSGENVIEATLSNELHQELDTTDKIIIHYDAADHAADTAAAAAPALSSGVLITLALVIAAVAAILAIGWVWMKRKRA
jgi:hypothetical protein